MMANGKLELLLLHALPLDGEMWAEQMHLMPEATYAPTLYSFGPDIVSWGKRALAMTTGKRLIVVGCSVGGSCALEVAALAPHRIAALVLIGTKASRRPDPAYHHSALKTLWDDGLEEAWRKFWAPLFAKSTVSQSIDRAKRIAMRQPLQDIAQGVTAFHTRPSREGILSVLPVPVVFVTGSDDTAPGIETSRRQAQMAKQGKLYIVPECGHYVPMERPKQLNTILEEVISAHA